MATPLHAPVAVPPKKDPASDRYKVDPKALKWARGRNGLTAEDLTKRFPKYREWEAGTVDPTLRQLHKLADRLHLPSAFLVGDGPPPGMDETPIPDFRSEGSNGGRIISLNLLDAISDCMRRQGWYRDEYAPEAGLMPLGFVGSESLQSDPAAAAARIRSLLDSVVYESKGAACCEDAFALLVSKADGAGILVMVSGIVGSNTRRRLDPCEFRGFAMSDPVAPLAYVNAAASKPAQMFALARGLAHLWLGESALYDSLAHGKGCNKIERWCGEVAAEMLVPLQDLKEELDRDGELRDETVRLAKLYKVGADVIARRLFDAGLITKARLGKLTSLDLERNVCRGSPRRNGVGGSHYRNHIARLGRSFSKAVVKMDSEWKISHRDAIRMLKVTRGTGFDKFTKELE